MVALNVELKKQWQKEAVTEYKIEFAMFMRSEKMSIKNALLQLRRKEKPEEIEEVNAFFSGAVRSFEVVAKYLETGK